jgi:4-amino-4-deoxy-L-arabinose transferase-like glycosyltransferase
MSIKQSQISKFFVIFLFVHASIWTLIPFLINSNLPLDTIEALAWASDIQWGYSKHPPSSAWFSGLVFAIFSNQDWAYYLLSQLFVVISFIIVWKFSEDFFKKQIHRLISVLLLEGICFYNFTSPEFNVYVCELPFWTLTVFYCWKGITQNDYISWLLFGFFAGFGVLSHYLFFYLLMALNIFFIYMMFKKKFNSKCLISLIPFLIVLLPHLIWLTENNFISINYALYRTGLEESTFLNHLYYPIIFLAKQIGIIVPFFIMLLFIVSKFKYKINLKDKKLIFLIIINIVPLLLIFLTSFFLGARIRTMWMTPFYLFSGVLCVYIFQTKIYRERFKYFLNVFLFLFILSPSIYIYHSISKKGQKTDYPGKEIAQLIQTKWDNTFSNEIEIVFGNIWDAGNLSYHLKSKPEWTGGWWHGTKEIPENTDGGIIVIGDYDENILVNKICTISNTLSHVVLLQLKYFNHNVCMIGKK